MKPTTGTTTNVDEVSIVLYYSHYLAISHLTDKEKGRLLDAIFTYASGGTPNFGSSDSEGLKMAFSFIRIQMDIDKKKYNERCERNKANARKRWQRLDATASGGSHSDNDNDINNENENEYEKDNDNENDNGNYPTNNNKKNNKKTEEKSKENGGVKYTEEQRRKLLEFMNAFNSIMTSVEDCRIKPIKVLQRYGFSRCEDVAKILGSFSKTQYEETLQYIAKNDYLNGRTKELKRAADFDWIIKMKNWIKAYEKCF